MKIISTTQAARELTKDEEDLLFQTGQFGEDDHEVLQRTVWWVLSLHFGFRARDESRRLQWGWYCSGNDAITGKQVLVWKAERGSKTRRGDGDCRAFNPKAYATENEQCPVRLFIKFASHRPEEMKRPEAPFFLAINHKRKPSDPVWYSRALLGKSRIGEFLTKAAKIAGLPGKVTNHFVRKACISRLMYANVPVNYVAQLSGHKNLKKLRFLQNSIWRPPEKDVLATKQVTRNLPSQAIHTMHCLMKQWKLRSNHSSQGKARKFLLERIPSVFFFFFFAGSNISIKLKAARPISLSTQVTQHLAAVVKVRLDQSHESVTLSSQMTQIQINLNFLIFLNPQMALLNMFFSRL